MTVTLPRRVLDLLNQFDPDRAVAIARLADQILSDKRPERALVEVVEMAPGIGLIVVRSSEVLRRLPWLKLIEIAPQRFLITVESGVPIETLEVGISDLIELLPSDETDERKMLEQLLGWIRDLRRARHLTKAELLLVSTSRMKKRGQATRVRPAPRRR